MIPRLLDIVLVNCAELNENNQFSRRQRVVKELQKYKILEKTQELLLRLAVKFNLNVYQVMYCIFKHDFSAFDRYESESWSFEDLTFTKGVLSEEWKYKEQLHNECKDSRGFTLPARKCFGVKEWYFEGLEHNSDRDQKGYLRPAVVFDTGSVLYYLHGKRVKRGRTWLPVNKITLRVILVKVNGRH